MISKKEESTNIINLLWVIPLNNIFIANQKNYNLFSIILIYLEKLLFTFSEMYKILKMYVV